MINEECRKAGIGCVDCKKKLAANLNEHFAPFREKRADLVNSQDKVEEILYDGARRARVIADQTIHEIHEAIGMLQPKA
jgi:tryptophanyl-tRNA synthetase